MGNVAISFWAVLFSSTIVFASSSAPHSVDFRYANTNRSALIGIPEGVRKPRVALDGSLTVTGESLEFTVGNGKKLSTDLVTTQELAEGRLPAVITKTKAPNGAELTLTSFTFPAETPVDITRIDVSNAPLTVTASVASSEIGSATTSAFWNVDHEPFFRFGAVSPAVQFQDPKLIKTNDYHVGDYSPYPDYWNEPPANAADPAFTGMAYGWNGAVIHHRFPVTPAQSYYVVLGFREDYWTKPGQRLMDVSLEDKVAATIDPIADAPKNFAFVRGFSVTDNGDGFLDLKVQAHSNSPDNNAFLSAIWIFDAKVGQSLNLNDVLLGKDNSEAKYFVACGDVKNPEAHLTLNFSPKANETQSAWIQRPWGNLSSTDLISPDHAFAQFKTYWQKFYSEGTQLSLPDKTVEDFYYMSIANIRLMEDVREGFHILEPGGTVYRGFWFRDGSYMANALTESGHLEEAKEALQYFLHLQPEDGGWNMPLTQWDSLGQAPWGLVHYWEITHDLSWLNQIYPALKKDVLWIQKAREASKQEGKDSLHYGLLPKGFGDGGMQVDYCFHQDIWALYGEELSLEAAKALGKTEDVDWMTSEQNDFKNDLMDDIAKSFIKPSQGPGHIPPIPGNVVDISFGEFLAALGPTRVLLGNPYMDETIQWLEAHEQEGLPVGIGWLPHGVWPYATADLAKGYLYKNEADKADDTFYAILNHGAPTRDWIEEIDLTTHKGSGDMPHGWAAANHILLLRDMLLREEGNKLYVGQGIPRQWLAGNKPIVFENAPTTFGIVSMRLQPMGTALELHLKAPRPLPAVVFNRSAQQLPIQKVNCVGARGCKLLDDTVQVDLAAGDNLITLEY